MTDIDTLNTLQEAGIISDNCVEWRDIAAADMPGVRSFLNPKVSDPIADAFDRIRLGVDRTRRNRTLEKRFCK